MKTELISVDERTFDKCLAGRPLAIPNGFKLNGSMLQTSWLEQGKVIAKRSEDGFGVIYEVLE